MYVRTSSQWDGNEALMDPADELRIHGQVLLRTRNGISYELAHWYRDLWVGQVLKRIEVIADDEDEIVEAVRRMSNNYDFVVTSGGIGPTYTATRGIIGFD
jgi:molybdopterin biosynthesis enzyme